MKSSDLSKYVLQSYSKLREFAGEPQSFDKKQVDACFVIGMGGSGVVGRYLEAAIQGRWGKPIFVVDGFDQDLPLSSNYALIAVSYSGSTLETLEQFKKLAQRARAIAVVSGKGELLELALSKGALVEQVGGALAPRFGFPQLLFFTFKVFSSLIGESWPLRELQECSKKLSEWCTTSFPVKLTEKVAKDLGDRYAVVYASEHLKPVGYRWKTQINENAKLPAFFSVLPEANHNEVNSWKKTKEFYALVLKGSFYTTHTNASIFAYIQASGLQHTQLEFKGETRIEEMLRATVIGDLLSIKLAEMNSVDVVATPLISQVKSLQQSFLKGVKPC
ncbi:hypothetical protein B9Q11_03140 [Candidatus Marsarchaeota G2 archaeon ECH_B_SAG-F08]|uniref:SIS domain-containing protein n=1 Tax=Candidatus Marsarchaeota G2 archaeon ECH_B_SAG-F08 TaxID=1978165 RepID=A0A2R6BH58_9ARCH|nr:MAG: hypothetical protein B9Q11_03140 [Candidatus Marsarchaeota G2 archaeon ECH_B_SAG-F08]